MGWGATAGMISGAGEAGTKALGNAQTGYITSELQAERDKMETARLQLQEQYAGAREQRGYVHAENLQTSNQDFQKGLLETKIGADIVAEDMKGRANKEEKGLERTSLEGIHSADRTSREKLAKDENTLKSKYYDAMAGYYSQRGTAAGTSAGIKGEDKKQAEYLQSVTKSLIENNGKQMELATPEEKILLRQELAGLKLEAQRIANVGDLAAPAEPTEEAIGKDRFIGTIKPKSSTSGAPTTTSESTGLLGTPSSEMTTVEPTRPVTNPRGAQDPAQVNRIRKQQLDYDVLAKRQELTQANIHGNKASQRRLQSQLELLLSQQEAASQGAP